MLLLFLLIFAGSAYGQSAEFARGGVADPREPRIGIGFLRSDLFADGLVARPGQGLAEAPVRETHGVVQLGLSRRLVRAGALEIGIQGSSSSRFRIDTSDNDALSVDYMIALPVVFSLLGTLARVRLIHRSAHLGDELVQNSTIRRLEYDHEEIDLLLSRQFGALRVYAGGALTIASSYQQDEGGLQAGVELMRPISAHWRLLGGADWQRHGIQDWADQLNGVVGVERVIGSSWIRAQGRIHSGASHLGEFFLERENAWGAEIIFGF